MPAPVTPITPALTKGDQPLSAADASEAALDDADALPAVGKVWDDGPKRSLGEILAAASRQRQAPQPQVQPSSRNSGPAGLSSDLATLWPAVLQQVQDELGAAVHVPLVSGAPSREADRVTVRFGGPFAAMARYLEKHRDHVQRIVSTVAGEALLLQFVADDAMPATPVVARSTQANAALPPRRPAEHLTTSAAPSREGVTLTPELRAQLEKDPLIRAVMEQFNGNIVKVEE